MLSLQSIFLHLWLLATATLTVAQYDPVRDFCRRFGHQSAVVDSKLYVDGGFVNWKPFSETSQNLSNPFLVFSDLNDSTEGMPTLHANLSKNATIPSRNGGALWEDSVNKRLYLYGGEAYQTQPTDFLLYGYDILNNQWDSFGRPTGSAAIVPTSYGAGLSISSRGEAYYYGGWFNNASVPGWTGPPQASNRLIKYTMDTNTWSNLTGPDTVKRAEGTMVFIPIGDAGMLVYFGGGQDIYGNGTLTPEPLDTIFLYDVANGKWYSQRTSGQTPENRRRFCGGATWAQDQSSYNIYIYGGAGFPPDTTGYDDIYVLTIPSFEWIRGPYPVNSNVSGPYPKSMMTCNVVNNAQMLIVGGTFSNDTTFMCDAESVWGEHNMNLAQENSDNDIWAEFLPSLTTYAVPTFIQTVVGGGATGGAEVTVPVSGFAAAELSALMTRKAVITSRMPTRDVSKPTGSSPGNGTYATPLQLSPGAIAGISVGGTLVLVAMLAGCCCFIRRRQRHYQEPRLPHQNIPSAAWGSSLPPGSSPVFTQASYITQPIQSPALLPSVPSYPPAELPAENQRHLTVPSMAGSPLSSKYDTLPWETSPSADSQAPSPSRSHRPSYGNQGGRGPVPGTPFWSPPSPPTPAKLPQLPTPRSIASHLSIPGGEYARDDRSSGQASHEGSVNQGSIM